MWKISYFADCEMYFVQVDQELNVENLGKNLRKPVGAGMGRQYSL